MTAMTRRSDHAYWRRKALRRWTVTAGGAFAATAADAAHSSSPVDGPVPRRGRRTRVRGPNVAASPTSGAVRGRRRSRGARNSSARARARVRRRTRTACCARAARWGSAGRAGCRSAGRTRRARCARTRNRRMTKLPWNRPWVVLAHRMHGRESRPAGLRARARRGGEQREREDGGGDGDVSAVHGRITTHPATEVAAPVRPASGPPRVPPVTGMMRHRPTARSPRHASNWHGVGAEFVTHSRS